MSILIAPSILAADFARLAEEVRAVAAAGCDYLHVDVMDGHFVPNLTIGPPVVAALREVTELPLDVHLMIEEPDRLIPAFAESGADLIGVHVEACPHLHRTLQHIRSLGKKTAVALNPATPPEAIRYVIDELDMILVMSVNPGFGGQAFIPSTLSKLRAVRELLAGRAIDLEVDGGIVVENAGTVAAAGANVLVSGTGIFRTPDYAAAISEMRAAAVAAARQAG